MDKQIYTLAKIEAMASKNKMKFAALLSDQDKKIVPFNTNKTTIAQQFKKIDQRLNSEMCQDGFYKICLAESIHGTKDATEFLIVKGDPKKLSRDNENKGITIINPPSASEPSEKIGLTEAVKLYATISQLEAKVLFQNAEIARLNKEIEEMDSMELADNKPSSIESFGAMMKDIMPGVTGSIEKYFELEERKLALKEKQASAPSARSETKKPYTGKVIIRKPEVKEQEITPGTQEHIIYLEKLLDSDDDDLLNAELDKLEKVNPELYKLFCEQYKITFENE